MTKQNKEKTKTKVSSKNKNLEPNLIYKIIGVLSIIGIPILLIMAILGKLVETLFSIVIDRFKHPLSHIEGLKNSLLEILSKSFLTSLYYSNLFMFQTGVHYEFKNEFIDVNPEFFENNKNSKSILSIDLSIPFLSKKGNDSKTNKDSNS